LEKEMKKTKRYAGPIVLGVNDALVELTGALAGLTFALGDGKIIAITGIIIGFAAALSMSASEYLSSREESKRKSTPTKNAFYTGLAYLLTVLILVLPYILIQNVFKALAGTIALAILIIAFYTYFISTIKSQFWKRFFKMMAIAFSIAFISFLIGIILKKISA
jgi:VIT1/CCC1 family predicted Fe2+/Mn2+ transporter